MLNHSMLEKKDLLKVLFEKFDRRKRGYISENDMISVSRDSAVRMP